ncbi:MAG: RNA-directed DNA polymerase, partial [Psychrobacter urativorans]
FRYSDDMIFIVDKEYESQLIHFIHNQIAKLKLDINGKKTQRVVFKDGVVDFDINNVSYQNPSKLQYLGLLYDGEQVFLRDTGISRYNRKLRKAIRMRSAHFRRLKGNNNQNGSKIHMRTLHSRFTYIGKRNYISYVFRVSEVHNSKSVKRQVKGHYKLFRKYLDERV